VKKWLAIGGGLLLVAWAPFIYAELTSEPAEKKTRDLPSDATDDEVVAEGEGEHGGEVVAGKAAAAPAAEPQAEAPEPEEPAAAEPVAQPGLEQPEATAKPGEHPEPTTPPEHDEQPAEGAEEAQEEEVPPPAASGPTAQLKKAYETEPRDALWATDTERRIGVVFGSDDVPEGMLQRASCRRAVCSLEVRWTRDHATQYVGAFQALHDQFGSEIGVEPVGEPDDEGQQVVHLYVLRKGYTAADLGK
jgi:hypothetical protein